jgi:hypothetical protein
VVQQVSLGHGPTNWALIDAGRVSGQGQIAPRLCFEMHARTPRERMHVDLHLLQAELRVGGEFLGTGFLTGLALSHGGRPLTLEIPVTRTAISYLEEVAPENRIDLQLKLTGWLRAQDDNEDSHRFTSDPEPGEPVFQSFGQANQALLGFEVARSDWFTNVLEPIGAMQYISTEIVLPRGDPSLNASLAQIRQAESAYAMHDGPAVFLYCRAAIDALPGAKQDIFASLSDRDEARLLDDLTRQAGRYFHRGRHVAGDGDQDGQFPVDHHDARFALNLTKLLVAHIGHLLA